LLLRLGGYDVETVLFIKVLRFTEIHVDRLDDLCIVIPLSSGQREYYDFCKESYLVREIVKEEQRRGEIAREEAFDRALLAEWPTGQVELAAKDEQDDGQAEVLCPWSQESFEGKGAEVFALCSKALSKSEMGDIARGPFE
jgi:hypothetical protein